MKRWMCAMLGGCAAAALAAGPTVELPLHRGWFEGQPVDYVTTDVSDFAMARDGGANYVPRLADALPDGPPRPGQRSSVDKIYKFRSGVQPSVLPSAPVPAGAANRDRSYSPLWVVVWVAWQPGRTPRELRSEEEVLAAQERGDVALEPTRIVVNCPVLRSVQGGTLPGVK